MYSYAKMVSICGMLVLSSALCATEHYMKGYRSETEVMLSLLHLDAMFSKAHTYNPSFCRVCRCIKNNEIEGISKYDMHDMVIWMVQMLQNYSVAKGPSQLEEDQRLHDAITRFFFDCITCNQEHGVTKQNHGPCFSQLVINSLDACDIHVLGDITVDGQIINPCCQGSGIGGPTGPTGPTGPIGPRGTCSLSDYLFATYFSTGFIGSDGDFIPDSSSYLEIQSDQEVVIPLEINSSMTSSGWSNSTGSNLAFVVPETGLYEISYQISLIQPLNTFTSQSLVAWIECGSGSESSQLTASSVAYFLVAYSSITNIAPLTHTFLATLNANEEISLICSNKGFIFGTHIGAQAVIVASGASSSIASSLVITKVA